MEKELEQAVQTVDFERAERVSDGLVSVERDREKLLVVGRETEAECDAVEVKMQEALEMQIVAKEECAGLLKSFAVIMEASYRDLIANPTITMDHLDSQMMKVSNLCNHELAEDDVSWNDEEAISWFKFEVHAARKEGASVLLAVSTVTPQLIYHPCIQVNKSSWSMISEVDSPQLYMHMETSSSPNQ